MNEGTQTEEKKLNGLAAYHEKKRLEREQKQGINHERKVLKEEAIAEREDQGIELDKIYIFEVLEKSPNPRHVILNNTCKIFDGERMRETKYIPVADTIFVDEMGGRYDGYPEAVLGFHNNQITVNGSDVRLVEFMLSHDQYDGNPNRISKKPPLFTLVNKADLEENKEKRFNLKVKALNIINETDIKEIYPIARVIYNIMDKDAVAVKNRLREKAELDPTMILNNIDSPRVKRSYVIQSALDEGVIEINKNTNSLVWSSTKALITEVRAIKDLDALLREVTDFTFTDEGGKVFDIIKQKITV